MYPVLEPHYELRLHPVEQGIIRRKGSDIRAPLNSVAMEILELCNGATSFDTICAVLAKRHDDTIEHVKELTMKFLQDAVERKYVSFHEEPVRTHGLMVGSREFFSPSHVGIELTHRCNLKCKHCYASATTHSKKQLSTADALVILEKLHTAGVASLMFTGGEATLHPGLFELLDYAMPRFERIQLFSNGWNINAQYAKKLLAYKPKIMVQISLDGKDAKTHDYIRGRKDSFDRVCNAIQMLTENQIHTVVAMLVTPFNKDQIEDVFLLSKN